MSQFVSADALVDGLGVWPQRRGPRYMRIADALEDVVAREGLQPGDVLPPERILAGALGVSRGTVVAAYGLLVERGVVERRQGSGTRVAAQPRSGAIPATHRNPHFSHMVRGDPPPAIDLSYGAPYAGGPVGDLTVGMADVVAAGLPAHGYAPLGLPALRQEIAALMTRRGTPTNPEQILVTPGAQGALQLLTTALLRRGDRVIVEAPTYPGAIELFSRAGAALVGVRRDHAGPRLPDLERALGGPGAALVFVVPTCHNPTGSIMHEQRRHELLALCRRHEVLIVEDQTIAEVVFDGQAPLALSAMDPDAVVAIGSFSKVMWGGLRIGWIRADEATIMRLGRLRVAQDMGSGALDQAAALKLIPRYDELAQIRRDQAAAGCRTLMEALPARLPEWSFTAPRGGYSLWVRLPPGTSGEAIAAAALLRGVAVGSGSASAPEELFLDHLRLCFSAPPERLVEAVQRLGEVWDERRARGAGAEAAA